MKYYKLFVILFIFYFISCDKKNSDKSYQKADKTKKIQSTDSTIKKVPDNSIKTNYTDKNGLKQGVWKTFSGNKLVKLETFKDGKLNGVVKTWTWENTEKHFKNGVIDSLSFNYFKPDTTLAYFVIYFENGENIWHGFPTILNNHGFPIKPITIKKDTVQISIPFKNRATFYKGTFIKTNNYGEECKGIGIHKMYYPNRNIKAEYNYDLMKVKIYDQTGNLISERIINANCFSGLFEN